MEKQLEILFVGTDQNLIKSLSEEPRIKLTIKENGLQAIEWLQVESSQKFDAILCNFFLRGIDGLAFYNELKHGHFLQVNTPFILVTRHFNEAIRKTAYQNGIDDYYSIPLNCENLISRIEFLNEYKTNYSNWQDTKIENLVPYKTPFVKRAFDVTMSLLALLALSPIFIFTSIAIYIESPGKVFYASKRVGRNFETFNFYKFRSMYKNADQRIKELAHLNQYKGIEVEEECSHCAKLPEGQYCSPTYQDNSGKVVCERIIKMRKQAEVAFLKIENDPRITKVGKFIRNTSIDELPQLINILKGDMSVVGNRPLPVGEANSLTKSERGKRLELGLRFHCAAGLTGLWQVELRGRTGKMSEAERFELDKQYALNNSFLGDMKLLFRTFFVFLKNQNV